MYADIFPVKALYIESGSKFINKAENTVVCMAHLISSNGRISSQCDSIRLEQDSRTRYIEPRHSYHNGLIRCFCASNPRFWWVKTTH